MVFRNVATYVLYIGILFYNVKLPTEIILAYTFFMFCGDGLMYLPKKIQKILWPIAEVDTYGKIYYNIEFVPVVILSAYIFFKTLYTIN